MSTAYLSHSRIRYVRSTTKDADERQRLAQNGDIFNSVRRMQQYWFVRNCSLFRKLTPDQLDVLERNARVRRFPRRSLIYLPHDSSEYVFLLADGRVRICSDTVDGKSATLAFVEPGELFGEIGLLQERSVLRDETAEAVLNSTVVQLPLDQLRHVMETSPGLTLGISRLMGFRRHRIERRLRNLLFRSNRERMIHLLIELAESYGQQSAGGIQLSLRLSHHDFASLIGATRESVTTVLGELQNEGYLLLRRQSVFIRRLSALAELVGVAAPVIGPVSVVESTTREFRRADGDLNSRSQSRKHAE